MQNGVAFPVEKRHRSTQGKQIQKILDNLAVMLGKIDELQQMYFSRDERCEDSFSIITIRGRYTDSLEESIEKFRCQIYGQKYAEPEHFPVAVFQIRRKIDFPSIRKRE